MFDGDGGITIKEQVNSIGWAVSIASASKKFNKMLIMHFEYVKIPVRYKKLNEKYHYCMWTKKIDSVKILRYLYNDKPKIYLKRKYIKYKIIEGNYNDKT